MKNFIFSFVIITSCLSLSLNAQNSSWILGLSGGTSFNKIKRTTDYLILINAEEANRTIRFNGGFDAGFRYGNFSLLSGLHFVQRGAKYTEERRNANNPWNTTNGPDFGVYTGKFSMASLSVPLLLRYELGMESLSFSLSVGPVFNFGLGSIDHVEEHKLDGGNIGPTEYEYEYGNSSAPPVYFKSSFVSFVIRPGVHFPVGDSGKFNVMLSYEVSGNIGNKNLVISEIGRNIQGSLKSSSIGISIGYEYHIDFSVGSKY